MYGCFACMSTYPLVPHAHKSHKIVSSLLEPEVQMVNRHVGTGNWTGFSERAISFLPSCSLVIPFFAVLGMKLRACTCQKHAVWLSQAPSPMDLVKSDIQESMFLERQKSVLPLLLLAKMALLNSTFFRLLSPNPWSHIFIQLVNVLEGGLAKGSLTQDSPLCPQRTWPCLV